jgi:hypothetical protein
MEFQLAFHLMAARVASGLLLSTTRAIAPLLATAVLSNALTGFGPGLV